MSPLEKIEYAFQTLEDGEIYRSIIEGTERLLIEKALERTRGNQIIAARILGLNRNTLRAKIKRLNIQVNQFRK